MDSRYNFLRGLRNRGELKQLHSLGLISYKPLFYLDVYEEYDKQIKLGNSKIISISITCDKFNIKSYTTIYKILNFFDEDRSINPNP